MRGIDCTEWMLEIGRHQIDALGIAAGAHDGIAHRRQIGDVTEAIKNSATFKTFNFGGAAQTGTFIAGDMIAHVAFRTQ